MVGVSPKITLFTSIANLGSALRKAAPTLPIVEIQENFLLAGRGINIDNNIAEHLSSQSRQALEQAEILVTEPKLLSPLLKQQQQQQERSINKNNNKDSNSSNDNNIINLSNLKWCQCTFAGVDALFPLNSDDDDDDYSDDDESKKKIPRPSFVLTRFSGSFGPPIAEWCLARIIGHERKFDLSRQDQGQKQWASSKEVFEYRYLSDLTLTILGCGIIGTCIAKAAKVFGMKVVGYVRKIPNNKSKSNDNEDKGAEESAAFDVYETNLIKALQQADYIVSVLPSTKETKGLLTLETFRKSCASRPKHSPSPVLLNVGRGDVIPSAQTLVEALDRGYLEAAILDVFQQEPLPPDNLLWTQQHPRVTISPHVSGVTQAKDVPNLLLENYDRYVNQQPLLHVVDWDKGY